MQVRLLTRKEIESVFSKKTTAIYDAVRLGMLTKPVKFSARCSRWPENEIQAIVKAHISGANDQAIKELVAKLHAARTADQPA